MIPTISTFFSVFGAIGMLILSIPAMNHRKLKLKIQHPAQIGCSISLSLCMVGALLANYSRSDGAISFNWLYVSALLVSQINIFWLYLRLYNQKNHGGNLHEKSVIQTTQPGDAQQSSSFHDLT